MPLAEAMAAAAERVVDCSTCGTPDTCDPCSVCADPQRDLTLICVVDEPGALWAMERAGAYRGRYHVLGGLLSALDGVGPETLRTGGLVARAGDEAVREVILALPATVDGQTTAPLPGRAAGSHGRGGHQPGPRRARGGRPRLAGRRHHRAGSAGAAAGLRLTAGWAAALPWRLPSAQGGESGSGGRSRALQTSRPYSRSRRVSASTSAAIDGSSPFSFSIWRTAWSTVVWSRLPKRRPMSG